MFSREKMRNLKTKRTRDAVSNKTARTGITAQVKAETASRAQACVEKVRRKKLRDVSPDIIIIIIIVSGKK